MEQQAARSITSSDRSSYVPDQRSGINSPLERPNPFDTPAVSSRNSFIGESRCQSTTNTLLSTPIPENGSRRYFRSRRVNKKDLESPKLAIASQRRSIFQRQTWIVPCIGMFIGLCISGVRIYFGLQASMQGGNFCPVFFENFASGQVSSERWTIERQVSGSNGEFDEMSDDPDVIFVDGGVLHIKPKMQDEDLVTTNGATIDLGDKCTGNGSFSCFAATSSTNGAAD